MSELRHLPRDLQQRTANVRLTGEAVHWVGRPTLRAQFHLLVGEAILGLFFFAITSTGTFIAVAGATGLLPVKFEDSEVWPMWARFVMPIFMLPFAVIGMGHLMAPIKRILDCRRMTYLITDQRILTLIVPNTCKSIERAAITSVFANTADDGSGSLRIGVGWHRDCHDEYVERFIHWYGVKSADRAASLIRHMAPSNISSSASAKQLMALE